MLVETPEGIWAGEVMSGEIGRGIIGYIANGYTVQIGLLKTHGIQAFV